MKSTKTIQEQETELEAEIAHDKKVVLIACCIAGLVLIGSLIYICITLHNLFRKDIGL